MQRFTKLGVSNKLYRGMGHVLLSTCLAIWISYRMGIVRIVCKVQIGERQSSLSQQHLQLQEQTNSLSFGSTHCLLYQSPEDRMALFGSERQVAGFQRHQEQAFSKENSLPTITMNYDDNEQPPPLPPNHSLF